MLLQTWGEVFTTSLQSLWIGFITFVPSLLVAIIIFIIGWVVGSVVGKAIAQLINALRVNKLFESAGAGDVMSRAGVKLDVGGFIGWIVKWFIVVVFLMTSLEIIGLTQVNDFLREFVLQYLPRVLIAALILILAAVIADVVSKIVSGSARAANTSVRSAHTVGVIARYAIWGFAFIIALSELGIAPQFMQILFTGVIAMLALAGGLAFGLGGRDAAAKSIDHISNEMEGRRM
jgi:hypothetical protein